MVTSPDQHKPGNTRTARILGLGCAGFAILMLLFGNHPGRVENLWLLGIAVAIMAIFGVDWALRRNGLRR